MLVTGIVLNSSAISVLAEENIIVLDANYDDQIIYEEDSTDDFLVTIDEDNENYYEVSENQEYEESILDNSNDFEANEMIFDGDNYRVVFSVNNQWDSGYNAIIHIKNTGDTVIHNWNLSFKYEDNISDIWNKFG